MTNNAQETENANPFKDFISDSYVDAVPETPAAAAGADAGGLPATLPGDGAGDGEGGKVSADGADGSVGGEGAAAPAAAGSKEGEAAPEDKAKPPKKTAAERSEEIKRRIANETRELREVERQLAARRTELGNPALTPAAKPAKDTEGRPKPADYTYGELDSEYIADLATHVADKRIAAARAENIRERDAETSRQAAKQLQTVKDDVFAKGAEKFKDFHDVVVESIENADWPLSDTLGKLVMASPSAADLLYHLATHQDEAEKISTKSPAEQGAYFGRLEAQFTAKAAPKAPDAKAPRLPAPITQPRGAGGQFTTSPDTDDFAAFEAMANRTA